MTLKNIVANADLLERPQFIPQKFICLLNERNETFQNGKKCKDKDLIWHMVGEMVK